MSAGIAQSCTDHQSNGLKSPLLAQSLLLDCPQSWTHHFLKCVHMTIVIFERTGVQFRARKLSSTRSLLPSCTPCFPRTFFSKYYFEEHCTAKSQTQLATSHCPQHSISFSTVRTFGSPSSLLSILDVPILFFIFLFQAPHGPSRRRRFFFHAEVLSYFQTDTLLPDCTCTLT